MCLRFRPASVGKRLAKTGNFLRLMRLVILVSNHPRDYPLAWLSRNVMPILPASSGAVLCLKSTRQLSNVFFLARRLAVGGVTRALSLRKFLRNDWSCRHSRSGQRVTSRSPTSPQTTAATFTSPESSTAPSTSILVRVSTR